MSMLSRMNGYFRSYRESVNQRRTERLIGTLPPQIRKDIGWRDHGGSSWEFHTGDGRDNRGVARH